jgi:1-acyl-sn-glycerol-3-phosphate acyltransferase
MASISSMSKEEVNNMQGYSNLRAFFRLISFLFIALTYFIVTLPFYPLFLLAPFSIRKIYNYILSFYAKIMLILMGIKVNLSDEQRAQARGKLLVGNHMSYIDVLFTAAVNPGCFVTSVEMKKTPFLGQICQLGGCVFVERRNRKNLKNEIREITESLRNGLDVFVFPEATSTNGDEVIRFRRPLFNAAIDAGVEILPFTINYLRANNLKINTQNRDLICWYGDMTFFDHLWNLFAIQNIEVSLDFHNRIQTNAETEPLVLAELSHEAVKSSFHSFKNR